MINCNAKAMTAKCSPWSLQEALHREMEMARAIFPGQNCSFLVEPTTKEEMGKFSNKICPARQELKINILHDICAGFLVAENPELIQMPCKAARDFVKHCVSKYLPRYVRTVSLGTCTRSSLCIKHESTPTTAFICQKVTSNLCLDLKVRLQEDGSQGVPQVGGGTGGQLSLQPGHRGSGQQDSSQTNLFVPLQEEVDHRQKVTTNSVQKYQS